MKERPFRILQVVGGMRRGGIETWLMHVLRAIDRSAYRLDFLVHTAETCAYDEEILDFGAGLYRCSPPADPLSHSREFRSVLKTHGPYHVVHSHVNHSNGWILRLAHKAGVPVRVAHSHRASATRSGGVGRRIHERLGRHWIWRHSTLRMAVSEEAAGALFGRKWRSDARTVIAPCGIDLSPYSKLGAGPALRTALGLSSSDVVVGHVGRFVPEKNHAFLLEVARHALSIEPRVRLLLVGDGPLQPAIDLRARELGIRDRVVFAGSRADVPQLMLGAMDVLVFPSIHEGLGLVPIESQAAGLTTLMSDRIPAATAWRGEAVQTLPLGNAGAWAEAALAASLNRLPPRIQGCPFSVEASLSQLLGLYHSQIAADVPIGSVQAAPCAAARRA